MRQGPRDAKSKKAKTSVARKSSRGNGARVPDLEKRLAEPQEHLMTATTMSRDMG